MKSLQELLLEEKRLIFPFFNEETARELGDTGVKIALKEQLPIAIRIERESQILYQVSLAGTGPDNDLWLSGKSRVVKHFLHSSFYISRKMIESNVSMSDKYLLDPTIYRAKGGAVPLFVKDSGLAAVLIVSGLEDHDDHDLSIKIVAQYLGL